METIETVVTGESPEGVRKYSPEFNNRMGKGRPVGAVNQATKDVRKAISMLAENLVGELQEWIERVAVDDPARAADLLLRCFEYHIPKVTRLEVAPMGPAQSEHAHLLMKQTNDPAVASKFYLEFMQGS
jgi:hypothetical protein